MLNSFQNMKEFDSVGGIRQQLVGNLVAIKWGYQFFEISKRFSPSSSTSFLIFSSLSSGRFIVPLAPLFELANFWVDASLFGPYASSVACMKDGHRKERGGKFYLVD